MIDEDRLPMDGMEDRPVAPPPADNQDAPPAPQQDERNRDESGRFAPKPEGPRGQPNAEAARRREAAERDEWKGKAEESEKRYAALQKRLDDMAALAKGDQQPEAAPDPLKDIAGKIDGLNQRFEQQDQVRQQEEAWNAVRSHADADEQRFTQEQPDFPQAVQHYITSRLSEMQALGIEQGQAEQALQQEAQNLLIQCAQQGRSPAQAIYGLAKARGYQGSAMPTPTPSNGNAPAPRPGGRSFGTGGGPTGGGMTAQQIAQMSEDDYNAFRSTPEGKRAIQRAMMG